MFKLHCARKMVNHRPVWQLCEIEWLGFIAPSETGVSSMKLCGL
jgi:hypothetical protein